MDKKLTILLILENKEERSQLYQMFNEEYNVVLADNYDYAISILKKIKVSLIIMGLNKDNEKNLWFVERCVGNEKFRKIPIILSVDNSADKEEAVKYLENGVWDYIKTPYNENLLKFRVKNIISTNEMSIYRELKYRERYDLRTGMYNRNAFFEETRKVIDNNPQYDYAFIRFDIHKFQLVNQFYGIEEGDRLIKFIAHDIVEDMRLVHERSGIEGRRVASYGHIMVDVFCCCVPYISKDDILQHFKNIRDRISTYGINLDLLPVFGVYIVKDRSLPVNEMYDRANMASKKCKGNYVKNYAFYDESMGKNMLDEQMLVNEMSQALADEQFEIYLQPKYEVRKYRMIGAEALVRWIHPQRGMISPGDFIPLFESNGFIMQLDEYVWEHACMLIRKWLDDGRKPCPISVNMSRVSVYNPHLVEILCGLVKKYNIPPRLLELELTESAFVNNPAVIKKTMEELQNNGFTILMDDFGTGYSALNALKDISLDVIKMDMSFLSKTEYPERSKCIMASLVKMAKRLKMSVVVEGVETKEQLEFLRSIGCEFIQGYYFAKPMPVEDYEVCAFENCTECEINEDERFDIGDTTLLAYNEHMDMLFNNIFQPIAMYEYIDGDIETIRVNNSYQETFGFDSVILRLKDGTGDIFISKEDKRIVFDAFKKAVDTQDCAECEYCRMTKEGVGKWVRISLMYMGSIENRHIIFATLTDMSMQKKIQERLMSYKNMLFKEKEKKKRGVYYET